MTAPPRRCHECGSALPTDQAVPDAETHGDDARASVVGGIPSAAPSSPTYATWQEMEAQQRDAPPAAQPAEPPATDATPFVYLINRMERAAQQDNPAAHEYAKHRAAVFEFVERQAREIESLRAECGLRQIQGYNEGKEAASARLYEAEAEQLTRDMRQRADRAEAERDALRADAERYRWLRPRLYSIDFDYSEAHATVLVFEAPVHPLGPGLALDAAIDAARAKVR